MNKIIYHKNCRRHEAVSKAKRLLNKAVLIVQNVSDIYVSIELTGVSDIDYREVKCYVDSEMRSLKIKIEQDIIDEKEYNHGYHFRSHMTRLEFIKALDDVCGFIANNYPEIEQKQREYTFTNETFEGKYRELKEEFKKNPIEGYAAEHFVVLPDGERRVYGITFQKQDLAGVSKLITRFL